MTGQTDRLLADLRAGDVVTPGDALERYGTMRLAARIVEARERLEPDEAILAERHVLPSGKTVTKYRLVRRDGQIALSL